MTSEQLIEYTNRLREKKWAKFGNGKILEYLMDRLSLLSDDAQKELILNLTERFEFVDLLDFMQGLPSAFSKAVLSKKETGKKILVTPLKSPYINVERLKTSPSGGTLFSKAKSSDRFYPLLKNYIMDEEIIDAVRFCDDPYEIVKKYTDNAVIILVDDFIGSGLTAYKHIKSYIKLLKEYKHNVNVADFCVVVDVAMKHGVNYLLDNGIDSFYDVLQSKAISEDETLEEKQVKSKIRIMKEIEGKVFKNLNPIYSLGFEGSESLVSILNKAPNNTFPFYWEKCVGDKKAVFRRYYD